MKIAMILEKSEAPSEISFTRGLDGREGVGRYGVVLMKHFINVMVTTMDAIHAVKMRVGEPKT